MINSKRKGARAERLWRDQLNNAEFTGSIRMAQQGARVNGNGYSPDAFCPMLPRLHNEVKMVQSLNVRQAMAQSIEDAGESRVPIVAHKRKNEEWLVTMRATDFFQLVHSGSAYFQ